MSAILNERLIDRVTSNEASPGVTWSRVRVGVRSASAAWARAYRPIFWSTFSLAVAATLAITPLYLRDYVRSAEAQAAATYDDLLLARINTLEKKLRGLNTSQQALEATNEGEDASDPSFTCRMPPAGATVVETIVCGAGEEQPDWIEF